MAAIGPAAAAAVPVLHEALHDTDPEVRRFAAEALGKIGREARKAVPTLLELQRDSAPVVRDAATQALVDIVLDAASSRARRSGLASISPQVQG